MALIIGLLVPLACFGLISPSVCSLRDAAQRANSSNSLKQIALAIHNYDDTFDELPQDTYTPDGKPMLSWRVHILPFIEEEKLYSLFRLDEPWDSPNNLALLSKMPRIYAHPRHRTEKPGTQTHYRSFSSAGSVFERRPATPPWQHLYVGPAGVLSRPMPLRPAFGLKSITDGLSNTIFVVEANQPVEWTKPDDLDASGNVPMPKMGGLWRGDRFNALFGDGSVRTLKIDIPDEMLRAFISYRGGEPPPAGWDQ
jgi:prepilin-type processing-associated H-X9-DG protein